MTVDLTTEFWQVRNKKPLVEFKNKREKIDYIYQRDCISSALLIRIFAIGYPKAEMIINELLSMQIIEKVKNCYQIKLRSELKEYLSKNL